MLQATLPLRKLATNITTLATRKERIHDFIGNIRVFMKNAN